MSLPICPIQHLCLKYNSGSNKPPNHHVRETVPCRDFLDMSCEESNRIQIFLGETLTCDITKVERIRREILK